jgi:hypothetical protein
MQDSETEDFKFRRKPMKERSAEEQAAADAKDGLIDVAITAIMHMDDATARKFDRRYREMRAREDFLLKHAGLRPIDQPPTGY